MDRLVAVNNETLYIDRSCLRCFFHRIKWNCLDAFNASATLRGTPLWYPLSQFPATRLSLCLIPPPFFYRLFLAPRSLFFPLPLSRFSSLFVSRFSFSAFLSFLLSALFVRCANTWKKEKNGQTREDIGEGYVDSIQREESNPLPLFCRRWRAPPPQKNVSALLKAGDARHRRKTIAFGTANDFVSLSRYFSRDEIVRVLRNGEFRIFLSIIIKGIVLIILTLTRYSFNA